MKMMTRTRSSFKFWMLMLCFLIATSSIPFTAGANLTLNEVKIYYKNVGYSKANVHFRIDSGAWTASPGRAMTLSSFNDFFEISIPLNGGKAVQAAFNNGGNLWDNNGRNDYRLTEGIYTIENGVVRRGIPIQVKDYIPPYAAPELSTSNITPSSVRLSWTAAVDNLGIYGYSVSRNGVVVGSTSATTFTDQNLSAGTSYTYTVTAFDFAGHSSTASNQAMITTGAANVAKVYYRTSQANAFIHFRPIGGTWTVAPGVKMEPSEVPGYHVASLTIGAADRLEAVFNNGAGVWDNNNSLNYSISSGTSHVIGNKVVASAPTPAKQNKIRVFYKSNNTNQFIHYKPEGGTWTQAPGMKMVPSEIQGFQVVTIDIGNAERVEAAFNNGANIWDNNNGKDYFFTPGDWQVANGVAQQGVPTFTPITLASLSGTAHSPTNGNITSATNINVSTLTKPAQAANKVEVIYTTDDGGAAKTVEMQKFSSSNDGDRWQVNLGRFTAKSIIKYEVKAYDSLGNVLSDHNGGAQYTANVENRLVSNFAQMFIRGTNNNFDTSGRMTLVSDHTWQITTTFNGRMDDRFKFDVHGNWLRNFGDDNNDRIADQQARNDIFIRGTAGQYTITFNDQTLVYTISTVSNKVSAVTADYPTYSLKVGETDYLSASVTPATATNQGLVWSSNAPEIVEVKDGLVTAKAIGTAEISISSVDNPAAIAKTTVNVTANDLHPVFSDTQLNYVFDKTALPEITVEISTAEWNKLLSNFDANPQNEIEVAADYTFNKNGEIDQLNNIGFRLRGNTSRRRPEGTTGQPHNPINPDWNHAHFAFKFSKFNKSQRFRGLNDMNTKWFKDDALHAREVYAYDLHKRYNVWTAPMSSYAKLTIKIKESNKTAYYGVYEMIEAINQDFINKRFPDNNTGNLWKGNNVTHVNKGLADFVPQDLDLRVGVEDPDNNIFVAYDLKTNKKSIETNGRPQLYKFITDLNDMNRSETWLNDHIDIDLFLRYLAVNVAVGSWDDLWINGNNYYFYLDKNNKFYMIPYDYDNSLGTSSIVNDAGRQNPFNWGPVDISSPLPATILSVPQYREQYKQHLLALIDEKNNLLDAKKSATRLKAWHKLIAPHVANDTGEDMVISDVPASWGNASFYRVLSGDDNTNFFRVKANSIRAATLGTTIYYSKANFADAYIHYQASPNGAWTALPGLRMQKSDYAGTFLVSVPGIVHKVAFHDGRGNWDSNGGKDYSFSHGTWTLHNGVIRNGIAFSE